MEDEFRVEVNLDDEAHGFSLGERLRALDLDDQARARLGQQVKVTRDGPRLFLYTADRSACAEAERAVKRLLEEDRLSGEVRSTRWHPIEQAWRDADLPLPASAEERAYEEQARVDREKGSDRDYLPEPSFVLVAHYKPEFLRDLGL